MTWAISTRPLTPRVTKPEALDRMTGKLASRSDEDIFRKTCSLVLFVRLRIGVARPSVTGFVLDSAQDSELWNVEAMDVLTP